VFGIEGRFGVPEDFVADDFVPEELFFASSSFRTASGVLVAWFKWNRASS
jgi:hypothetical protein